MLGIIAFIFGLFCVLLSTASGASITAADQRRGHEAMRNQKENIDRNLDAAAKKQNIYYNRVSGIFEKDFNYDGSPKHPGAKRLPHR